MRYDPKGECWVADEKSDLVGWTILGIEDWKPGVRRFSLSRPAGNGDEFRMVYVKVGS